MTDQTSEDDLQKTYIYHQLDEYPWDSDQEFQGGLRAILGAVEDPIRIEHLTLRAKCYYFARKAGTPVDFDGYKQWVEGLRETGLSNGTTHAAEGSIPQFENNETEQASVSSGGGDGGLRDAPKPASFAEICDMIAEGKPIPGIKDIPDTILEGQATTSQATKRQKPWESAGNAATTPAGLSWMQ